MEPNTGDYLLYQPVSLAPEVGEEGERVGLQLDARLHAELQARVQPTQNIWIYQKS